MRRIIILLSGLSLMTSVAVSAESETVGSKPRTVSAKELDEGTVVILGELGLPLLTAAEIEATVEEEHYHSANEPTGRYLLKIDKVAGIKLKEPTTLSFIVLASHTVAVAENQNALDELIQTLQARSLDEGYVRSKNPDDALFSIGIRTAQDAQRFKERYVGSRHRLVVFEVAEFKGWPSLLPKDCPPRDTGLSNHNPGYSLVVIAERKLKD